MEWIELIDVDIVRIDVLGESMMVSVLLESLQVD